MSLLTGENSSVTTGRREGEDPQIVVSHDSGLLLTLRVHCEMLGISAVVRPDSGVPDILHCTLCRLSFYFVTEATQLTVTQIKPYTEES